MSLHLHLGGETGWVYFDSWQMGLKFGVDFKYPSRETPSFSVTRRQDFVLGEHLEGSWCVMWKGSWSWEAVPGWWKGSRWEQTRREKCKLAGRLGPHAARRGLPGEFWYSSDKDFWRRNSRLLFQRPKDIYREEGGAKSVGVLTSRAVPSGNDVRSPGSCKYRTLRKKLQGRSTLVLAGFMLFRGQWACSCEKLINCSTCRASGSVMVIPFLGPPAWPAEFQRVGLSSSQKQEQPRSRTLHGQRFRSLSTAKSKTFCRMRLKTWVLPSVSWYFEVFHLWKFCKREALFLFRKGNVWPKCRREEACSVMFSYFCFLPRLNAHNSVIVTLRLSVNYKCLNKWSKGSVNYAYLQVEQVW